MFPQGPYSHRFPISEIGVCVTVQVFSAHTVSPSYLFTCLFLNSQNMLTKFMVYPTILSTLEFGD